MAMSLSLCQQLYRKIGAPRIGSEQKAEQSKDHSLSKGIINSERWHGVPSTTGRSGVRLEANQFIKL